MSIEREEEQLAGEEQAAKTPKLVVTRPSDHRRKGSFVSGIPAEDDTGVVNVDDVLDYIRKTPVQQVRRGRSKPNRTHRPAKPWLR